MILKQSWVGYLDRSYESIKKSLLTRLGKIAPEISDQTENNLLIIILEMFAGIAEMLSLYTDRMARETFIGTARKYTSVVRLARLMDYQIKARNPSSSDVLFYLTDGTNNVMAPQDLTITAGTIVKGTNQLSYRLKADIKILSAQNGAYGLVVQDSDIINQVLGVSNGNVNQKILLSSNYIHDSLTVLINNEAWLPYSSFGLMFADTQGFVVNIEEDGNAYLTFGDGVNGKIPTVSLNIIGSYRVTDGSLGDAPENTLTEIPNPPSLPNGYVLNVTNQSPATGGRDFETIEEIRNRAPRAIRTNNRTLTFQDYLDDPLLVPGINGSAARFCCGKNIDVFIIPSGRGPATQDQIASVQNFLNRRKAIGTFPLVQSAGVTLIWIKGIIYGKPLIPKIQIQLQITAALDAEYGFNTIKVNRKISASDIIALIENQTTVDRFELAEIKIKPFARPIEGTTKTLNITYTTLPSTTTNQVYTILYDGKVFEVIRQGVLIETKNPGETYNDGIITFTLGSGSYTQNDRWEFVAFASYPQIFPVTLIQINDYSAAVMDVGPYIDDNTERTIFSDLTIKTQDIVTEDLPLCG